MIYAENFRAEEFREWADDTSPRLVTMLDILRHRIGSPIVISPNPNSLGRESGRHDESAHNVDRWDEVLAADFFIPHVSTRAAAESVLHEMEGIGFTGIGLYSDTMYYGKPLPMFHGDVRPDRDMGDPAEWGRVNGRQVSIMLALQKLEN